jgi:hypothetical protein
MDQLLLSLLLNADISSMPDRLFPLWQVLDGGYRELGSATQRLSKPSTSLSRS